MFYWLIDLSNTVPGLGVFRTFLNVFRYITFRTGGAMVTGALFVFLFGPWIIDHLRLRQGQGQPLRRSAIAPPHQEGHADDGRADDLVRTGGLDAAVGQSAQSLCLDRARGDARLRLRRRLRTLPESDEDEPQRAR